MSPHHQLGDHGVIVDGHLIALPHTCLYPHVLARRGRGEVGERAGAREEAGIGVLSVYPRLEAVTGELDFVLSEW